MEHGRFFVDERFDEQRSGLLKRAGTDTLDGGSRLQFRFAVQQVVAVAMAELQLDAFVAPTSNAPAPKLGQPRGLGRHSRPDVWAFLGSQGIPNITVPCGFTTHVYDRVRDPSVTAASLEDGGRTVAGYGYGHMKKEGYRLVRRAWLGSSSRPS